MSTHYIQKGYTPIIEGRIYCQYINGPVYHYFKYKLVKYNLATECCKLVLLSGRHCRYISATQLSHWYIVGKFE